MSHRLAMSPKWDTAPQNKSPSIDELVVKIYTTAKPQSTKKWEGLRQ